MKTKLTLPIVVLAALFVSCTGIQPGNDPVVVNAERTTKTAVDTFNSVFNLEFSNHILLKQEAPAVVDGVNTLRRNAPQWIESARALTKAYKANRTAENKANLETALSVLEAAISQARTYIAQIGAK